MKINRSRFTILIIFITSSVLVLHDIYFIVIKPWFTTEIFGWTYFGFITFICAFIIMLTTLEKLIGGN